MNTAFPGAEPHAHQVVARTAEAFGWDLAIGAVLTASASLYLLGLLRLWRNAGRGRGLTWVNVSAFGAGLLALVVALLSPLDALSDVLFSAHMGQHEILMLVAAPLLVMGKPWLTGAWALPARWRGAALGLLQRPALRRPWRSLTAPVAILLLHAAALWIWHIPGLFEGALKNETVHAFQHLCFFVTAVLFWWALVQGRYGRAGYGAAALFVFLTAMHSGILGALLTVAGRLWYPIYESRTRAAGFDPLADQQLAGLLMWIPAGVLLAVLGLGFLAAWLGESERRSRAADAALGRQLTPSVDGH
jgi:putative membrane protein